MISREDMIKFLDRALDRFPEEHKYAACAYCKVMPEPADCTLYFEPGKARIGVTRWLADGWLYLNANGGQKPICPDCVKKKGL